MLPASTSFPYPLMFHCGYGGVFWNIVKDYKQIKKQINKTLNLQNKGKDKNPDKTE